MNFVISLCLSIFICCYVIRTFLIVIKHEEWNKNIKLDRKVKKIKFMLYKRLYMINEIKSWTLSDSYNEYADNKGKPSLKTWKELRDEMEPTRVK